MFKALVALITDPRRFTDALLLGCYEPGEVIPSYLRVESSSHACQLKATIEKNQLALVINHSFMLER